LKEAKLSLEKTLADAGFAKYEIANLFSKMIP
jgi:hypothetical protein